MADERVDSEIVTQFLLNTCRLRPQITKSAVDATLCCALIATPSPHIKADLIPLTTGSVAEFYIEPILPCVGDVDVMHYQSSQLAIPRGHPPPIQLPAEFSDYVEVLEIIDSHFPGYVYLKTRYVLTYCPADEKYKHYNVEYDEEAYVTTSQLNLNAQPRHGPAVLVDSDDPSWLPTDAVACARCLSWPPQAADWPTRHRNHGWPDSVTVDRVVNHGCDVVRVAHRQCRQHEWMGEFQFRLSFSRAEIVLINSWMPVQQIVYHMLRIFMKTERLTNSADSTGTKILSNYHIKTLLLWACELKPRSWWTDGLNLVKICVKLLHTLSVWLNDRRSQHYFINDCNLMDNTLSVGMVANELISIGETYLSLWFVENYIRKCAELCPDVDTNMNLQNCITAIVNWRLASSLHDAWNANQFALYHIAVYASEFSMTLRSFNCLQNELEKINESLTVYLTAVTLLQASCRISRNYFSDELMDVVASVFRRFADMPWYYNRHSSELSLIKATKLMKVVAIKSCGTVQLIEIELSKAYLHRALRCKDSDSDSIYCLANVYLAVLYYTTGQYQTAIDHCALVMRSQDHSQCSSHVVQGELLPKIDDDIDIVLGLAVFYQYVLSATLNRRQQRQYFTFFTTELFGYHLHIKFLAQMSTSDDFQRYLKCITETHYLSLCDVLVFKLLNSTVTAEQTVCRKSVVEKCGIIITSVTGMGTIELVELLQKCAVEHLTTFRHLRRRDFGFVATNVTTDFEALYEYKRGNYNRCLQLSIQNVKVLVQREYIGADVTTHSEFIQLFDDDIVSLKALTLIVKPKRTYESSYDICITQLTLSLYLMTQCQLKLRHSLTSLAETLDYNEFVQTKMPLERTLDHLTLSLTSRKIVTFTKSILQNQ